MQMFDEFSVSYDIDNWGEYVEMILSKARLSYERIINLENVLNYISYEIFTIYYRHSILKAFIELVKIKLNDLRIAKKKMIKMKTIMTIDKNLRDTFKVQDNYIKNVTFI